MTPQLVLGLRKRLGFSQAQMGMALGVSGATVSMWETGLTAPDPYKDAAMVQMISRLDQFDRENRQEERNDFVGSLVGLTVVGGVIALLGALFSETDE